MIITLIVDSIPELLHKTFKTGGSDYVNAKKYISNDMVLCCNSYRIKQC